MADLEILIQCVVNQRDQRPTGWRILYNGIVQRVTEDNPPPGPDDLLGQDRALNWQDERQLTPDQVVAVKETVANSVFFDLPPRLVINYCKEDPGAAIWTVNIDGRKARVVVYDPKPKRSAELDALSGLLTPIVG